MRSAFGMRKASSSTVATVDWANYNETRCRLAGAFPSEMSASTLATETMLRSSEEWALKRYLTISGLQ